MAEPDLSDQRVFWPRVIVSGGQTGVDRAALEAAIALGIGHGGWCPKDRLAEDGTVPSRYNLQECASRDYRIRTEQNVLDSDATLILYQQRMKGGTSLTAGCCRRHDKPLLSCRLESDPPQQVQSWLSSIQPAILNIAGPRESSFPGIYERALAYLLRVFAR